MRNVFLVLFTVHDLHEVQSSEHTKQTAGRRIPFQLLTNVPLRPYHTELCPRCWDLLVCLLPCRRS